MAVKKEIIVLNGGGHKGVVKISGVAGRDDLAKVSCSLDFRPSGAYLYLVGENIAKVPLKDVNCEVEVPFCVNGEMGCVVRSSSLTMFGGSLAKSMMLSKIDEYNHKREQKPAPQRIENSAVGAEEVVAVAINSADCNLQEQAEKIKIVDETNSNEENPEAESNTKKKYVGVSSASEVNPLGEWTKYDGNNFYYAIKPQLDEMFICYPEEKLLCDTVPNSKWVHVDAEDGYYVVGLLYDESEPSFICYGVPQHSTTSRRAPAELESMCVWLPVSAPVADSDIVGYWVIYQSARTGEIIK